MPAARACWRAPRPERGVRLLHISTDAVFDGSQGNYTESDTPNPINTYARTKLEANMPSPRRMPGCTDCPGQFYGWSWQGGAAWLNSFSTTCLRETLFMVLAICSFARCWLMIWSKFCCAWWSMT